MLAARVVRTTVVSRTALRALSAEAKPDKPKEDEVQGYKPQYATKADYDRKVNEHRFHSVGADSGYAPSKWQRKFLVWTRLYAKTEDIPEFVGSGTMNRMHDRMRVLFIVVGVTSFFTIFYIFEKVNATRIDRDREAGKVVTRM